MSQSYFTSSLPDACKSKLKDKLGKNILDKLSAAIGDVLHCSAPEMAQHSASQLFVGKAIVTKFLEKPKGARANRDML